MSKPERTSNSHQQHQPLVDKDPKAFSGKSSGGNSNGNNYNYNNSSSSNRSGSRGGEDFEPQNLKNYYLETNTNQHQALQRKLRKLQIRLYFLAGVVVVGFILLITLCAVFFAKLHHDVAHHTHKPTLSAQMAAILEEGVCVSCDDFKLGASARDEDQLNKFIDESSGSGRSARCCADTGAELLELLKLFIERRFRLELAKGTVPGSLVPSSQGGAVSGPKPAALLLMAVQDKNSIKHETGLQQVIKKWRSSGDMAFLAGGAKYDDGRIVVPEDGYYYVYCHISFTDYLHRGGNHGPLNLAVYLYRYNILYEQGGEENLARQSISKCESLNKDVSENVVSIGSVFNLRREDQIFVKVSNITSVDASPKSSYFGFFKI